MLRKMTNIKEFSEQFRYTLASFYESVILIRRHKLWSGFWKYGWVSRFLIFIAALIGLKMLGNLSALTDLFQVRSTSQALASMGNIMQQTAMDTYSLFTDNSMKYVMLILLEVLIFHACRQTLSIIGHDAESASFQNFLNAQVRMIKVGVFAWAMGLILSIPVKVFFGLFSFMDFLEPIFIYLIHSFFLGFAIMDNFNEQFKLTIKESYRFSQTFLGVGLAIGIAVNALLQIPLLGVIVAPLLAAVTATLVLYAETERGALARSYLEANRKKKQK
jgi:hypothetical protein